MKDVIGDINAYYGNLGRQGMFKSPIYRQWAQTLLLAPQWVEGLIQKEVRFASRLGRGVAGAVVGTVAPKAGRVIRGREGLPTMGTLGRGVARGLIAGFVLTQTINLATRRKFTWQNEEEKHKGDAWIPVGEGHGLWFSPMSVFGEVFHDILRISQTKEKTWDAILQVGFNKLGPIGRMLNVLAHGKNERHEEITSTAGVIGEAAKQVVPVMGATPISLAPLLKAGGHKLAPDFITPNKPGEFYQRMLSSVGFKTQVSESALRDISDIAHRFVKDNHLTPETGWTEEQTEEASFTKLRAALRNDDMGSAKKLYRELLKGRDADKVYASMKKWSQALFTGSAENERLFLNEITAKPHLGTLYANAMGEKLDLFDKFEKFSMTVDENP